MNKISAVSIFSILLLAQLASAQQQETKPPVQEPTEAQIEQMLKDGTLKLEAADPDAPPIPDGAEEAAEHLSPPPALTPEEMQALAPPPPIPGQPAPVYDIFSTFKEFECSKVALDAAKKPVYEGSSLLFSRKPKFVKFSADYQSCEFDGPIGERWHALFPAHPARGDRTCEIVTENQRQKKCITCFPTPESCRGENWVAALPSANTPATADTNPDRKYPLAPPSMSYAARIDLIKKAKKSIRIQYLIFFGDESGWGIAKALIKKKQENPSIDIRVNVDALSNLMPGLLLSTQDMYFDLKQHGIPVEGYEFAALAWVNEFSLKNPVTVDYRWHDKLFAIDAEDPDNAIAIVGGQNIANEYFRIGQKPVDMKLTGGRKAVNVWRDHDIVVKGPIVRDVAKTFDNNFNHFKLVKKTKKSLFGLISLNTDEYWQDFINLVDRIDTSKYAKPTDSDEWYKVATWKKMILNKLVLGKNPIWQKEETFPGSGKFKFRLALKQPLADQATVNQVNDLISKVNAPNGGIVDKLRYEQADMRWFNSHPRYGETYIMQAYIDRIKNAKKSILISNAYFVPSADLDPNFVPELKKAAERCVEVTVLTNAAEASDGPVVEIAGRTFYKDILSVNTPLLRQKCARQNPALQGREPMAIYEWMGQKHGEFTNHAKFAIFDRLDSIVGSFNLDPRSAILNSETALLLRNAAVSSQMHEQIVRYDIKEKSELVTPALAAEYANPASWKGSMENWKSLLLLKEL